MTTSFHKCMFFVCTLSLCLVVINGQMKKCGEDFTSSTGTLQSPSYPYTMDLKQFCKWTFNITNSTLVYLTVINLDLGDEDNFTVSDGISPDIIYDGINVPDKNIFVLSSVNSSIAISIGANQLETPRRFFASFTTLETPYYTTERNGMIKSPFYSLRNDTLEMTWIITKKPGTSIYLSFRSFNITNGNVLVHYGQHILNFSGSEVPSDIPVPDANVNVTLQMSLSVANQSFEMHHSQLHPNCSKVVTIVNSTEVNVTFEEPVIEYPIKCFVIIEGPENAVMTASVVPEKSKEYNDSNTVILLNDGGGRFSPNLLVYSPSSLLKDPNVVLTSSNRLWIGYSSVPLKEPVTIHVNVNVHNSGKTLRGPDTFILPKKDNATLVSDTSVYVLTVKSDQQVVAKVSPDTTLNEGNELLFYDGRNYDKIIASFNVNSTFFPIVASENEMVVVAKDFKDNDTFTASFSGYPTESTVLSTGKVGSYQLTTVNPNITYLWIISPVTDVDSSGVIAVTFNSIDIKADRSVIIYDGVTDSAPILYQPSNFTRRFVIHNSAEKGLKVVIQNNGTGFLGVVVDASYEIQNDCVQHLNLTNTTGTTIISPGYPGHYPINANCTWNITANKKILLSFEDLNLPETRRVLIYSAKDTQRLLANVSGNTTPDDLITDELPILIMFKPPSPLDSKDVSTGFKINVLTLDCGGMYDQTKTEFHTQSYPKAETLPMLCVWSIIVPEKKDANVEIISMSYSSGDTQSNSAQLTIHEGGSLQSPAANMSAINQTNFLSRINKLVIKYENTNDKSPGTSYRFNYTTYVCEADQLCNNGLCLHASWRCNGVNDCGDFTDELSCAATPIYQITNSGVSVATFVVVMFVVFLIGVGVAIGGPILWRKFRTNGSYQEFRNTADA